MGPLGWVVALIFLVTAIQLVVYLYFGGRRGSSAFEVYSTDGPSVTTAAEPSMAQSSGDRREGRRCPACGAVNDPSFTFCRDCISRIGA